MNKRMLRNLIGFVLSFVLLFSGPLSTFAYIGAVMDVDENIKVTMKRGPIKIDGVQYERIENNYIHFDICTDTKQANMMGQVAHTVPTETMSKDFKDLKNSGTQNFELYYAKRKNYDPDKFNKLTVKGISWKQNPRDTIIEYEHDGEEGEDKETSIGRVTYSADLAVYYTFKEDPNLHVTNYFTLVKMNQGDNSNYAPDIRKVPIIQDEADTTQNWGVQCVTVATSDTVIELDGKDMPNAGVYVRQDIKYNDFPRMGHASITTAEMSNISVQAQYYTPTGAMAITSLNSGIDFTQQDSVIEVYSDSYTFAAPFVEASYYSVDFTNIMNNCGIYGHGTYAQSISYKKNVLTTRGQDENPVYILKDNKTGYWQREIRQSTECWGFRNLSPNNMVDEETGTVINPDKVKIAGDAPYLCVFNKENEGGKQVIKADTKDDIKKLTQKYGKPLAQYQGTYVEDTVKGKKVYLFNGAAVALSPSITATWDATSKSNAVKLWEDGKLELDQKMVSLNAPTFKFYNPKGEGGLTFDGYDEKLGIKLGIDPDKNDSYINIDLPGNGVSIKGANIDCEGNLVFTGKFKINLFVAEMEMLKLGYGMTKDSSFECNGIHAKGTLKVPKAPGKKDDDKEQKDATPNVLGFGGAKMSGEVNTFKGEELYDFSFEMTIKNLFSTQAELTLVRLNNGRLCPEHLYFEIKVEAEGVGLDIPPGTPVVTLTGGGGGIDGLASTIDGNYVAIPPVVLTLVAYGEIVKIVDGKLTVKVGPSQLKLIGEDVGFKIGDEKLKIIDSMYAGVYLNGKEVTYGNEKKNIPTHTYTGVAFGGEMGMGIKIFNFKDGDTDPMAKALKFFNDTITASVALSAETYVGSSIDVDKWCYVYIGSTGSASCSLNVPKGVPVIGGMGLLGAGLDYKIMAQTAFETGKGGKSAAAFFKNASLSGGIAATGTIFPVSGRVIYFFPANKVKLKGKLFSKFGAINWDEELLALEEKTDAQTGEFDEEEITTMLVAAPALVENEEGEEAIMMMEANIMPIGLEEISAEGISDTFKHTVTVKNAANIDDEEQVILMVVPKDINSTNDEAMESFKNSVSCNAIDEMKWVPEVITVSENDPGYNAWVSTYDTNDKDEVVSQAVYLAIPKAKAIAAGGISVTANSDFTLQGLATTPTTELEVNHNKSNGTLDVKINNADTSKNYVLYTYMGQKTINEAGEEQIGMDYLVDSRSVSANDLTGIIQVPVNGQDLAPSGDYYFTTSLVEEMELEMSDANLDAQTGKTETIDAEIPVTTWQADTTFTYTNSTILPTPQDATLSLLGNEAMKGSWKKVDGAEGYRVNIYQETTPGSGEYVDTERGYTMTLEDFENTPGLVYDEATQTYSIEMAMTVGESGKAKNVTMKDGTTETINTQTVASSKALEPDKNYKIGVSAYKKAELALPDENGQTQKTVYDKFGAEALSAEAYLPVYKPVTFDVSISDNYEVEQVKDESGKNLDMLHATVGADFSHVVTIGNIKDGNTDVSDKTEVTVTAVGMIDEDGSDKTVSMNALGDDPNSFFISEFSGSVSLEIKAKYTHDGVTDETVKYLNIDLDNTAPVITLQNEIYYSDDAGNYEIIGMTEPGVMVKAEFPDGIREDGLPDVKSTTVKADTEGKFKISGILRSDENTRLFTLTATDAVNNVSEITGTVVSRPIKITHTVVFEDGFGNVLSTQEVNHGEAAKVPVIPSHEGYTFNGWDRDFSVIEENIRITALWVKNADPTPTPSGGTGTETKEPVKVSSLKLSGISNKIAAGKKIKLEASILPENADNKTLKWSSSNTKVAMVDQSGNVRVNAKAGGKKVVITAETTDGSNLKATFKINVMKKAVKSLKLKGKKTVKVKAGKTVSLKATVKAPKGANKKLKWISSDPAIATVNSKGKVKTSKKSKKGQKVKITVMTTDGTNKKKTKTIIIK